MSEIYDKFRTKSRDRPKHAASFGQLRVPRAASVAGRGERLAVTLSPAAPCAAPTGATLRALRAAIRSPALPAMQHRIELMRRLLAAFILASCPDGRRGAAGFCKPSSVSSGTGIVCSVQWQCAGRDAPPQGTTGPHHFSPVLTSARGAPGLASNAEGKADGRPSFDCAMAAPDHGRPGLARMGAAKPCADAGLGACGGGSGVIGSPCDRRRFRLAEAAATRARTASKSTVTRRPESSCSRAAQFANICESDAPSRTDRIGPIGRSETNACKRVSVSARAI